MTDQQRLRETLRTAVPEPPADPTRGASARGRARARRRQRMAVVGSVVVVVTAASAGLWAVHRNDDVPTVSGTGKAACRQLVRDVKAGRYVDSRVVDGPTAASWLGDIATHVDPATYRHDRRVTVCLTWKGTTYATYAIGDTGHHERVTLGRYSGTGGVEDTMATLDRLWSGGRPTTNAPFRCPGRSPSADDAVTTGLPAGSTGALLCYRDSTLYSPRGVLSLDYSDRLVNAIDRAPLDYVAPNVACGGIPDFRSYSIVFRYRSGTRTVTQEECRGLALGPFTRGASDALDRQFEQLLLTESGGLAGDPPSCPSPAAGPEGVGDVRHIVAARYCASGDRVGSLLTGRRLAAVRRWGAGLEPGTTQPEGACSPPRAGRPHLTFYDAWGNSFTATVQCTRNYVAVRGDDAHHRVFYPLSLDGRPFQRLLRELATQPR